MFFECDSVTNGEGYILCGIRINFLYVTTHVGSSRLYFCFCFSVHVPVDLVEYLILSSPKNLYSVNVTR